MWEGHRQKYDGVYSRRKCFIHATVRGQGVKGKAIRVSRSNLRDVTNRADFQDEEATVEIASLTRTGSTMTYSEVDMRKAEAVSKEAMAIADFFRKSRECREGRSAIEKDAR